MEAMRHIVLPPPNIQPIVDNIARQIAEKGEGEEHRLKTSHDGLLSFLEDSNELHPYFVLRKVTCIQQIELVKRQREQQEKMEQMKREEEARKEQERLAEIEVFVCS